MATKQWIDETGLVVDPKRVTKVEKLRERHATKIVGEAAKLHKALTDLKALVRDASQEVWVAVLSEKGVDPGEVKGNFTWYNFDRSVKIEVSINERIDFDDALIAAAKAKFDEFLSEAATISDEMVKQLVMDAFSTKKGKLDVKRVMGLLAYRQRVDQAKYPGFHQALDLIEQAIRRPDMKRYYRISTLQPDGDYQDIQLNFASI